MPKLLKPKHDEETQRMTKEQRRQTLINALNDMAFFYRVTGNKPRSVALKKAVRKLRKGN